MILRPAIPADLADIRALHTANWRADYGQDLSDAVLGPALDTRMGEYWAALPDHALLLVARDAGERFLGFLRIHPEVPQGPYVDALHVMPALRGQGTGAALMAAGAARLRAAGHDTLWLRVMERNAGARRFYARLGGQESAPLQTTLLGEDVHIRIFRWAGLAVLAGAA